MSSLIQNFLDLVLPRECVGCQVEETWLCDSCTGGIKTASQFRCPFCETEIPGGRTCAGHKNAALAACVPCGFYHDPVLRAALRAYKYYFAEELAAPLAALAARTAIKLRTLLPDQAIVAPIPLSKTKLRSRGFNQTLPIAAAVAQALGFSLAPNALLRARHTKPQASLTTEARRANMTDAFIVHRPKLVQDNHILLIDDVSTTGATLETAACPLKNAGARSITALVLARG